MTVRKHVTNQTIPVWMDDAVCAGKSGDLWFEDNDRYSITAKRLCQDCPAVAICLQWALDTGETWGVWGGKTAKERENIRRRDGYAAKKQASPVRVLSPMVAAATADRAARALAPKQARAQVLGSTQTDEVAEQVRTHRANNTPLLTAARKSI